MDWDLRIERIVEKHLKKFPVKDADRIREIIKALPANPYAGDIERMQGEEDAWRRRIGSYRLFYDVRPAQKVIYVYDVKRRTSSTY